MPVSVSDCAELFDALTVAVVAADKIPWGTVSVAVSKPAPPSTSATWMPLIWIVMFLKAAIGLGTTTVGGSLMAAIVIGTMTGPAVIVPPSPVLPLSLTRRLSWSDPL